MEDWRVRLEVFEGPLDLLLYLIRKNELDIYDIPIALIVEQYQQYLDMMRELNLELAGEFLVMASTLSHIKSRMLLPSEEEGDEEEDPRRELVELLLEYQKYKEAAQALFEIPQLGREVFVRSRDFSTIEQCFESAGIERIDLEEVGLFQLLDAFQEVLKRFPSQEIEEVVRERVKVIDMLYRILEIIRSRETVEFSDLFSSDATKEELIATFLALLELIRLQVVKAYQGAIFAPIKIVRAVDEDKDILEKDLIAEFVREE